ncbi:MAG: FAD-binding protein, partial [Desulfobacterales bacterium]|nr:FAD-binding protein [Desulfobacterales bacterium]
MKHKTITINGKDLPLITTGVAIVGSGTAALNAATHLDQFNIKDILIITQKMGAGTSANTGSDKQTYYRLNPSHPHGDSTLQMAEDLFSGHCMHGDIALVESALSLREFFHLVELGVPFPQNRFGDYIGFQTDHDTKKRGTSAGPRTSIKMYENLRDEVIRRNIPVLDNTEIIDLLTRLNDNKPHIAGLLALKQTGQKQESDLVVI